MKSLISYTCRIGKDIGISPERTEAGIKRFDRILTICILVASAVTVLALR